MAEAMDTRPNLTKSYTVPEMSKPSHQRSPLPPAVVLVDSKGYVHSKKVNNYMVGGTLGEGSFAKVKEAFHVVVGEKVAMKIIDKKKALQDAYVAKNFKREAKLLQKINHPNIIKLYEVIETENNYYLITELCSGGEVMKHIYKEGHLSEEETRKFVRQTVSAIDHLHKAGIIHRDLKVENMMLDNNKNIKLIDFGLSNEEISLDESGNEIHCRTQCGSPAYAAPELLGQREYNKAADIWSIGVNMYAMLTGCLPFTVEPFNITALHAKMLQNKMNPIPEQLSDNCRDILKRMLVAKPDDRITMEEMFTHPWLNEDLKLPFLPHPYPNTIKTSLIKENIIEHMTIELDIGTSFGIKQDLIANKATSLYAIYHLLLSRLKRYEKEYSTRVTRVHEKKFKKKVSRDHGFYEDDDSDTSSTITSSTLTPTSIGKKTASNGVMLRQKRAPSKSRPISDDVSNKASTLPVYSGRRRLSDILEDRRSSMPEEMLKLKEFQQFKDRKKPVLTKSIPANYTQRVSHPQTNSSNPHYVPYLNDHILQMSPPHDPYEFDFNGHTNYNPHPSRYSPTKRRSLPRDLSKLDEVNTSAWGSNPSSRMGSRQSSTSTMPPIKGKCSLVIEPPDDDLEFHEVSTPQSSSSMNSNGVMFFVDTPPPYDESSNLDLHLPSLNVPKPSTSHQKSPRRRNGWVVPTNGDCTVRTEMQVGAIISEIFRTAHDMRMKSEPQLANTIKCEHKSVKFEIGVRKISISSCTLHFEWLTGGSARQFNDACAEVLHRIHL